MGCSTQRTAHETDFSISVVTDNVFKNISTVSRRGYSVLIELQIRFNGIDRTLKPFVAQNLVVHAAGVRLSLCS